MLQSEQLAFKIANTDSFGLKEGEGLLTYDGEHLSMEIQEKDALLGVYKSEVKEYEISLDAINSISFKKKFFSAQLTIQANSMKELAHIPGMEQGKLTLKIAKKNADKAKKLQSLVNVYLSEQRLRDIDIDN